MNRVVFDYVTIYRRSRTFFISFNNLNKINVLVCEEIKNNLFEIIKMPRTNIVLSMAGINFIDSSGFSVLNLISRVSHIYKSKFTLIDVGTEVMELISLIKNRSDFSIYRIIETGEQRACLWQAERQYLLRFYRYTVILYLQLNGCIIISLADKF